MPIFCPKCDGRMKILAVITKADSVRAGPPPQVEFPGGYTDELYADQPSRREPPPVRSDRRSTSVPEARNPIESRLFSLSPMSH